MEKIEAGYVAWNGYVFTADDARWYMMECERAHHFPHDEYINARHKAFCTIIAGARK